MEDDEELSEGQKIMLADGCPREFLMSAERRRKLWEERPPKYMSTKGDGFFGEKQMVDNELQRSGEDQDQEETKGEVSSIDRSIFSELVSEFNRTVDEAKAVGLTNVPKKILEPSLKSDKDVEKQRKKLNALRSSITAFQKGQSEADAQDEKESNVRKSNLKVKAKTTTKSAPKKSPTREADDTKKYVPGSPFRVDDLVEYALGKRTDSNKGRCLEYLQKNYKKPVTAAKLSAAVYEGDSDNLGPLYGGVVGGLNAKFKEKKLPVEIFYNKEDKTYVLQPLKR